MKRDGLFLFHYPQLDKDGNWKVHSIWETLDSVEAFNLARYTARIEENNLPPRTDVVSVRKKITELIHTRSIIAL